MNHRGLEYTVHISYALIHSSCGENTVTVFGEKKNKKNIAKLRQSIEISSRKKVKFDENIFVATPTE